MKIGLKVWSTNIGYLPSIVEIYKNDIFDYIELFVVPGTYKKLHRVWNKLKNDLNCEFIIHAPHYASGLNLSLRSYDDNFKLFSEALQYADDLEVKNIIFHPGCEGTIEETIRQLKLINDFRILVENKPKIGIDHITKCVGYSPKQIEQLLNETGYGFCFDIGHAICSANSEKVNLFSRIDEFKKLNPVMYHLSDGDRSSEIDQHLNYKKGNYPIYEILEMLFFKEDTKISIETKKSSETELNDFINDSLFLKEMFNGKFTKNTGI